jgi:hypothetical protein
MAQRYSCAGKVSFALPTVVEGINDARLPSTSPEQMPWVMLQGTPGTYENGEQCAALNTAYALARVGFGVCMLDPEQVRGFQTETAKALRRYDRNVPQGLCRKLGSRTLAEAHPRSIRGSRQEILGRAKKLADHYEIGGVVILNPTGILDDLTLDVISRLRPHPKRSKPKVIFSRPVASNIRDVKDFLTLVADGYRVINPEDTRALSSCLGT